MPVLLLLLGQFVCSVQRLTRVCWRWWNLGNWSPPPPWEYSRRWTCLGYCWLLGQGCWPSWGGWWYQTRYKEADEVAVCGISLISTFRTLVIARRRARFPSLLVWRYTPFIFSGWRRKIGVERKTCRRVWKLLIGKGSEVERTKDVIILRSLRGGHPIVCRRVNRPFLMTRLKALVRSINAIYLGQW